MKFVLFVLFIALVIAGSQKLPAKSPAQPLCKAGKTFRPNSCVCKFKTLCTPKLCLCYQTIDACPQSFTRRSVCLCKKGTRRQCNGSQCKCVTGAASAKKPSTKDTSSKKPTSSLPACKINKAYRQSSCLCSGSERCSKKFASLSKSKKPTAPAQVFCMCFNKVQACPSSGTFPLTTFCKCKGKDTRRRCTKGVCSCQKVPACNPFGTFPTKNQCFCSLRMSVMYCKKTGAGKRVCRCRHLSNKCAPNKPVTPGKCYCNLRNNTWKCSTLNGKRQCTCAPKPMCQVGVRVKRNSCSCTGRPIKDLMDENSEKKRVYRGYGWQNCRLSNPKDTKSTRICSCEVLPCYSAGRFRKYFCKCPRLTKQKCNKKTGYCKCQYKKAPKITFRGEFKFMGLIKTSSHKIASLRYLKRKINVWTQPNKTRQEVRYAFVEPKTGSFYVVRRPSLKNSAMNVELALYVRESQNWQTIQDQLKADPKKKVKKTAKKIDLKKK